MSGILKKIWLKRSKGGPMDPVSSAELITGEGIRDNANQRGKRQVTIIEEEAWQEMMRELEADIDPAARRANMMVSGVSLHETRGRRIRIVECIIEIYGETKPCEQMDEAFPGLRTAMQNNWRGGAFGVVVKGGIIKSGDSVFLEGK